MGYTMAKRKNMLSTVIKIAFILFSTDVIAADYLISLPGKINQITSPQNNYTLYNVDYDNPIDKFENHHSLFLMNSKTHNKQKIYNYGRHVEAMWSLDNSYLSINDYGGSDFADCIIFRLDNNTYSQMSVKEQLKKYAIDNKIIFGNHHSFITCQKWINDKKVLIKADGYGGVSPNGFEIQYELDLASGIITPSKKS